MSDRRFGLGSVGLYAVTLLAVLSVSALVSGCASTGTASSGMSGVRGFVTAPVEGAYVFIYEDGADPHGPPFAMSEATGPNGEFEMELPDGDYTLVARKHKNGLPGSPLSPGDQKTDTLQVTVKNGRLQERTLVLNEKTDDQEFFSASDKSETAISGRVLDSEGAPMRGLRVHVYTYSQMSERPKYVSAATGPDGKYIVFLPKGGTYYLAARDHFGGPPKIGDYYGRYDEGTIDPSGVILKTGQTLENLNIIVHKVW